MTVFIAFIKSYYPEIMIVLACSFGLFEHMEILQKEAIISAQESKIIVLSNDLKTQNDAILANKADYVVKTEQLPAQLTKIVTKYKTIYKTVDSITEDKNATCEDMVSKLNNTDL